MTYKPFLHIARELINKEIQDGRLTKDNAQTVFTSEGNFYKETTGAYTNVVTSWGTTVTSNATYNNAARDRSVIEGDALAHSLCKGRGSPRWKGTLSLRFFRMNAGELINFTSYAAGIVNQDLRVKVVTYNIGKYGAFVTLSVEEDEKKKGE